LAGTVQPHLAKSQKKWDGTAAGIMHVGGHLQLAAAHVLR
jgi:hypothetical protein